MCVLMSLHKPFGGTFFDSPIVVMGRRVIVIKVVITCGHSCLAAVCVC